MRRIVIAIGLSGLLAACGQQAPANGEAGAPAGELDFIEAVPIDEDAPAPIAQPQAAAKKDEPATEAKAAEADEADEAETPVTTARVAPPSSEPAAKADDAASATRRANETTATPYETTPRPN